MARQLHQLMMSFHGVHGNSTMQGLKARRLAGGHGRLRSKPLASTSTPPWLRMIGPFRLGSWRSWRSWRLSRASLVSTLACSPFAESHLRPLSLLWPWASLFHPFSPISGPDLCVFFCSGPPSPGIPLPRSFIFFSNRRRSLDLDTREGICPVSHLISVSLGFEASESLTIAFHPVSNSPHNIPNYIPRPQ